MPNCMSSISKKVLIIFRYSVLTEKRETCFKLRVETLVT